MKEVKDLSEELTQELISLIKATVADTLAKNIGSRDCLEKQSADFQNALYDYIMDKMNKFIIA